MEPIYCAKKTKENPNTYRIREWRFIEQCLLVIMYISLLVLQTNCQTILKDESSQTSKSITKIDLSNVDNKLLETNHCHSCHSRSINEIKSSTSNNRNEDNDDKGGLVFDVIDTVSIIVEDYLLKHNKTEIQSKVEMILDDVLKKEKYEIIDGVEIELSKNQNLKNDENSSKSEEGRGLFSKYTYEYRMLQKIKNFIDTHILSINLPKAERFIGFRSFGLKKFFLPLFIGAQVFKSIMLAMFLPSILGSFGKILGKGISQLSATSSQASYPPAAPVDEQDPYNTDNKDFMAYETDQNGAYTYPQDANSLYANMADAEVNDVGNVDLSRFGVGGSKVSYLPSKAGYYKNQVQAAASNNYKVFQKIPSSSMILSNYDPFYSPLLSRLDGIFARLGLAPQENSVDGTNIGGQSVSDIKLEACREQLICLMYTSPAKYAPYSNLVSAQLSRELNELRRPVSDNPEILRFFRYMRAARRGQEGTDCVRAHPACHAQATPQHTMIAAYQDINKLVSARKLKKK